MQLGCSGLEEEVQFPARCAHMTGIHSTSPAGMHQNLLEARREIGALRHLPEPSFNPREEVTFQLMWQVSGEPPLHLRSSKPEAMFWLRALEGTLMDWSLPLLWFSSCPPLHETLVFFRPPSAEVPSHCSPTASPSESQPPIPSSMTSPIP
jgi:hypothetical protein